MLDLEKVFETVEPVIRKTGSYVLSNLGKAKDLEFKGQRNIVTSVDKTSEQMIRAELEQKFPDFKFLGEEFGGDVSESYHWLVDPIDGTNNFYHNFPVFCISIALLEKDRPLLGLVYDPVKNELFSAREKQGAYLNTQKIKVSGTKKLRYSLLATGFNYEFKKQSDTNIEHFINFLHQSQGVRRCGSAALDLAYVASGRLDGFWELGLKPWDTAAGWLIVKEAGGEVTKINGSEFNAFCSDIAASNGSIHKEMIQILSHKDIRY